MQKKSIEVLSLAFNELGGKVFAMYFLRKICKDESVKKSVASADFLQKLMTGQVDKEWELEDDPIFKDFLDLAITIDQLTRPDAT